MLAQLMDDTGTIIALDRTPGKVAAVESLARDMGITCISTRAVDATQLCPGPDPGSSPGAGAGEKGTSPEAAAGSSGGQAAVEPAAAVDLAAAGIAAEPAAESAAAHQPRPALQVDGVAPESFDAILLDAPCSALGLRPRLLHDWKIRHLESTAGLQRALMHSAVHLLKPGGVLVYCTCTINPGGLGWRGCFLLLVYCQLIICCLQHPSGCTAFSNLSSIHFAIPPQVKTRATCGLRWTGGPASCSWSASR